MFQNDRKETATKTGMSIRHQNDIEKSTCKTHLYFVDFESRIHVEVSMSNQCHNFHVNSPFKIDEISTNFPPGIWTINSESTKMCPLGILLVILLIKKSIFYKKKKLQMMTKDE